MLSHLTERATAVVATGLVASPWWVPSAVEFSALMTPVLQLLGAGWLILKAAHLLKHWHKK